ncbi:hypothetical protein C6353_09510 [Bacillus toyonensis]|nr:hypothetical protein C6353_09510 [Bacillus toyonensis]
MTKSITKTKVDLLFYKEIGPFVYVLRYKRFLIFSGMFFRNLCNRAFLVGVTC